MHFVNEMKEFSQLIHHIKEITTKKDYLSFIYCLN